MRRGDLQVASFRSRTLDEGRAVRPPVGEHPMLRTHPDPRWTGVALPERIARVHVIGRQGTQRGGFAVHGKSSPNDAPKREQSWRK